jgi:hypothetical protein
MLVAGAWWPQGVALGLAIAVGAFVVYMLRHLRFVRRIGGIEAALRAGELENARALAAPLLDRYPQVPLVQKTAADVLYASGDPLSAASLYERAAKRMPRDRDIVVGLVAA